MAIHEPLQHLQHFGRVALVNALQRLVGSHSTAVRIQNAVRQDAVVVGVEHFGELDLRLGVAVLQVDAPHLRIASEQILVGGEANATLVQGVEERLLHFAFRLGQLILSDPAVQRRPDHVVQRVNSSRCAEPVELHWLDALNSRKDLVQLVAVLADWRHKVHCPVFWVPVGPHALAVARHADKVMQCLAVFNLLVGCLAGVIAGLVLVGADVDSRQAQVSLRGWGIEGRVCPLRLGGLAECNVGNTLLVFKGLDQCSALSSLRLLDDRAFVVRGVPAL